MATQADVKTEPWPEVEWEEGYPIAELDREALDALAERWLANLFASVNRPSPFYRKLEPTP